jgi:predicted DNA-binding transcriptional regulator YafY
MRRADRLFQIVQRLRRRGATTAAQLAESLEVSERTIYRDVRDLLLSGVPIRGEAGVGYVLQKGFDFPPLMFDEDEIEALVLGARVVKSWADPALASAAERILDKVEAVLPERLRSRLADAALFAPSFRDRRELGASLSSLRSAIRKRAKVRFRYLDREEKPSLRTVKPLGLFYWGQVWSLGAWCELRVGFRNFRVDRVGELTVLADTFAPTPGQTLGDLFAHYQNEKRSR